ncbi:hypothetical protein BG000_000089 [Podila horticola]|nr:hypothetical protein BG000_000089 [Podila horticola]
MPRYKDGHNLRDFLEKMKQTVSSYIGDERFAQNGPSKRNVVNHNNTGAIRHRYKFNRCSPNVRHTSKDDDKKARQSFKSNETDRSKTKPSKQYKCNKCSINASHDTASHKECSYCLKAGHIFDECRKRLWDEKQQANGKRPESENTADASGNQSSDKGKNAHRGKGYKPNKYVKDK